MIEAREVRELLVAEEALDAGLLPPREVALALKACWDEPLRDDSAVASCLAARAGPGVEGWDALVARVDARIGDAGGDPWVVLVRSGGLAPALRVALSEAAPLVSEALGAAHIPTKSPLPVLRPDPYIDFREVGRGGQHAFDRRFRVGAGLAPPVPSGLAGEASPAHQSTHSIVDCGHLSQRA